MCRRWGGTKGLRPAPDPAQVKDAQRMLTALAYYAGPIDGLAGPKTRSAVATSSSGRASRRRAS